MKEPLFIQIYEAYKKFILLGVFKPGDKLPSVREVADNRGLNPHTVNRAFLMLEDEGYIETIFKKGSFVKNIKMADNLHKQIEEDLKKYKAEGLSYQELLKLIKKVYGDYYDRD